VDHRAGLDSVAKKNIVYSFWESNLGRLARSLVNVLTELSRLLLFGFFSYRKKYQLHGLGIGFV